MSSISVYQELDQNIDALLAGAELTESDDPTLRELMAIARELRELPSAEFRERLAVDLTLAKVRQPISARDDRQRDLAELMPTLLHGGNELGRSNGMNFVASFAAHAAIAAIVLSSGMWVAQHKDLVAQQIVELTTQDYILPEAPDTSGGGGGGGDRDKLAASKGELPKFLREQITPPAIVVRNENPKLAVQPTVVGPPSLNLPLSAANLGDPMSNLFTLSNGTGSGGGIGSGSGGGVGSGSGSGVGPGYGGGIGGGVYRVGGGVSAPRGLYMPDPDYSEEARKAKYQGTVVLWVVIGADGKPHDMRVERSLGMGLDQKALEAVRRWKFAPAEKDGRPVAVQVHVEVNFRLF